MPYAAPVADIAFWLKTITGIEAEIAAGTFPALSIDVVDAVLTEAGRFATEVIAPLNAPGDTVGARLDDGVVTTPPGWKEAFVGWAEGGWTALTGPPDRGGQGLPTMLQAAVLEMWNGASTAFATGPMLTTGAIEAIDAHGSEHLKALYLPPMIDGRWTGTMNLTEPQAGSDLGALRARAEPAGDGSYRVFGQKIFITYGEHDLTENIVHLVLARLPDAPAGTRGISLFVVPKFIPDADGRPGRRNDLKAVGLEHKLGIHASPTCVMQFGERDGAVGWLVGEPHRGLAAMFTMMNNARLSVGIQGVGVAERAYQRALAYALDRRQGRAPDWTGEGMSPIVHHPDVKRMLLTMRALTDAARALCFDLAHAIDRARQGGSAAIQAGFAARAALLTPVAKSFATDIGFDVASLGVQIHGGMGFIEETGAAQDLRDARILSIYEGTNGIQAIDLVTRKLPLQNGAAVEAYIAELDDLARDGERGPEPRLAACLGCAVADLRQATAYLQAALAEGRTTDALAGATAYQRLFALTAGAAHHLRAALASDGSPAAARRRVVAGFFAADILPQTSALRSAVTAGGGIVDSVTPDLLTA